MKPTSVTSPAWLRNKVSSKLTSSQVACYQTIYRDRLEVMRAIDDLIGTVVRSLISTNQFDNTVLLFTSDNGFQRGEHRLLHKRFAYEESIRVPLYIRHPQFATSRVEPSYVLNNDLAPTIVELTGSVALRNVDGRSLVPFLEATPPATWRKRFLVGHTKNTSGINKYVPSFTGVRSSPADLPTPNLLYVQYANGSQDFYDLAADPYQLTNVVNNSSRQQQVTTMNNWRNQLKTCGNGSCQTIEAQ